MNQCSLSHAKFAHEYLAVSIKHIDGHEHSGPFQIIRYLLDPRYWPNVSLQFPV